MDFAVLIRPVGQTVPTLVYTILLPRLFLVSASVLLPQTVTRRGPLSQGRGPPDRGERVPQGHGPEARAGVV